MGAPWLYEVYDEGILVMTGVLSEIREKFGDIPNDIHRRKKPWLGRYVFVHKEKTDHYLPSNRRIIKKPNYKPPTKAEKLERVYYTLKYSGVTCLGDKDKASDFVEYLKERGINVTVRKGKEVSGKRNKIKYYDILEVVKENKK